MNLSFYCCTAHHRLHQNYKYFPSCQAPASLPWGWWRTALCIWWSQNLDAALHILHIGGYIFGYLAHRWIYFWISCTSVDTFLDILRFEEVEIFGQFHVVSYSIVRLPGVCGNRRRLQASQYVSSLLKKWVRSQEAFIISIWILWTGCRQGYAFQGSVDLKKTKARPHQARAWCASSNALLRPARDFCEKHKICPTKSSRVKQKC